MGRGPRGPTMQPMEAQSPPPPMFVGPTERALGHNIKQLVSYVLVYIKTIMGFIPGGQCNGGFRGAGKRIPFQWDKST